MATDIRIPLSIHGLNGKPVLSSIISARSKKFESAFSQRPYGAQHFSGWLTQDCASLVLGYYPSLPPGGNTPECLRETADRTIALAATRSAVGDIGVNSSIVCSSIEIIMP
ncbi:MAG: hypothetical protein WCA89_02850 [Terracidiphilus sp.]|jgi:hypothetical protein